MAALALFVVALGGVVLRASTSEQSVGVGQVRDGARYALPPAGSSDIDVGGDLLGSEGGGAVYYTDPAGVRLELFVYDADRMQLSEEQFDALSTGYRSDATTANVERFGEVLVRCPAEPPAGPASATWLTERQVVSLVETEVAGLGCAERVAALERQMAELRLVDRDQFDAFVREHVSAPSPPVDTGAVSTTTTASTSSTAASQDLDLWCRAIEEYRSSGTNDPITGLPTTPSLPYLQEVLDVAPSDLAPPIETMIGWVEAGRPMPLPEAMVQAGRQATLDWATQC